MRRIQTRAMLIDPYLPEAWTHILDDGSATCVIQDGRTGIVINHPNCVTETASSARGKH